MSERRDSDERRVVVVGAGISGLAAAHHLITHGPANLRVTVVEGADRVGGKLASVDVAGVAVDTGAEAFLVRTPEIPDLLGELGVADEVVHPAAASAAIAFGGRLWPIPGRTVLGVPADVDVIAASGLFSDSTVQALRHDLAEPRPAPDEDVSVAELVGSRGGPELVGRLVEPLLGGVYAGRADRLSAAATMPAVYAALRREPALVAAARAAGGAPPPPDPSAPPRPVFGSLPGGLGRVPGLLRDALPEPVRVGTPVREIHRTQGGFRLVAGPVPRPEALDADAVIVAVPAAKAGPMLAGIVPAARADYADVASASMAVVTLAFAAGQVSGPPPGSGVLVPATEGRSMKAATYLSQKWPHLGVGTGLIFVRASVGRVGDEWQLQRGDDELVEAVRGDLADLVGLVGTPVDATVTRWGGGLPQYDVGHLDRVRRIRAAVEAVPGLAVCGALYDGVGVPACVRTGRSAADRVLADLALGGVADRTG